MSPPGIDKTVNQHFPHTLTRNTLDNHPRRDMDGSNDNVRLSGSLNNLTTLPDHLRNLLVLMRQQAQRVRNIVPLPLALGARESRSQFAGELFGVLVLWRNVC
jgi:hypothetical protein